MTTLMMSAPRKLGAGGAVRVQEALQYIPADCDRNDWV